MFKAEFKDLQGNLFSMSKEETVELAEAYVEKWKGTKGRRTESFEVSESAIPKDLTVADATSSRTETDESGFETTYYTFPADATVTITDLSKDEDWVNEQAIKKRRQEYPSVEEVINIIFDHGIASDEFNQLKEKRSQIKKKYPKFKKKLTKKKTNKKKES